MYAFANPCKQSGRKYTGQLLIRQLSNKFIASKHTTTTSRRRNHSMLTCSSCMKRCLQSLIGDSATISSASASSLKTSGPASQTRKLHTTSQSTSSSKDYKSTFAKPRSDSKNDRQKWLDSRGTRPADKPAKVPDSKFVVRKHLQYLKDPVKLADFVRDSLRKDEYETTLEVVRSASKSIQCTVSWNHLIDYTLTKGRMNAAIKIYNEVSIVHLLRKK